METTTIATLGPTVRLVVFKFLVKSELVPDIPLIQTGLHSTLLQGKQVLDPTPNVWLAGLRTGLLKSNGDYLLVGARVTSNRPDGRSDVRFTFCRRNRIVGRPHMSFVSGFHNILNTFINLTRNDLWKTMAHLNPYFDLNKTPVKGSSVVMLSCAGRNPAINPDGTPVMVYEGGRESSAIAGHTGQGIGEKIPILEKSPQLKLVDDEIRLITS